MTPTCSSCGTAVTPRNKSGMCRGCLLRARHADPVWREKRLAALRIASASPESRERKSKASKEVWGKPEMRAMMSEVKKRTMADPVKRANVAAAASKTLRDWHATTDRDWSAWHRERHARTTPWCPADRVPELRALAAKVGRAEAERILREDIAAKARAAEPEMTPFERQLARVAAGAKLVEVKPLRRADPDFTLGGVSSSYL